MLENNTFTIPIMGSSTSSSREDAREVMRVAARALEC